MKDRSHLTTVCNGNRTAHLYLRPKDGEEATEDTEIDHLTWEREDGEDDEDEDDEDEDEE